GAASGRQVARGSCNRRDRAAATLAPRERVVAAFARSSPAPATAYALPVSDLHEPDPPRGTPVSAPTGRTTESADESAVDTLFDTPLDPAASPRLDPADVATAVRVLAPAP